MNVPCSPSRLWAKVNYLRGADITTESARSFLDDLRKMKREQPSAPQGFATLFSPARSGKTSALQYYIENCVVREAIQRGIYPYRINRLAIARSQRLVVRVTPPLNPTLRQLAASILGALGDPCASRGTTTDLVKLVHDGLKFHETELLCFDEAEHLCRENQGRGGPSIPPEVTSMLKDILDRVPILFVGAEQTRNHLFSDQQLAGRCRRELHLRDFGCKRPSVAGILIGFFRQVCVHRLLLSLFKGWFSRRNKRKG